MLCHEFLKAKIRKHTKSSRNRMSDLLTSFAELRTLAKHLRNRGCENVTHSTAVKKFFKEEEKKDDSNANGSLEKQIIKKMKKTIPERIIFRRLHEFI